MAENITTAKELMRIYLAEGIPAYLHGPPGVGKSDAWQQIAAETRNPETGKMGINLIDLRLAMMDPVDLLGLQAVSGNRTIWNRPAYWPNEEQDGRYGILLFDEMSDCSRAMQSAAYQLILNGRAGPHILPKGWYRCAAGNRREDKAAAQALSTALANRFAHIDIEADPEAFILWANASLVDPDPKSTNQAHLIPAFIRFRPKLLHSMAGADLRAFPTPRAWAKVAKIVGQPQSVRFRLVKGLVGEGAAAEFEGFMKTLNLPTLAEILKDPAKCMIPEAPASKYALCSMLARYADEKNFGQICKYVSRKEYGREFEICTILDATKRSSALCETASFVQFANRNANLSL